MVFRDLGRKLYKETFVLRNMGFGKKGSLWMWFWIFVAIILGCAGLYYFILWLTDASRITSVGTNTLSLILAQ